MALVLVECTFSGSILERRETPELVGINPLESALSGVRLRTDAAERMRCRDNALYLVFKIGGLFF